MENSFDYIICLHLFAGHFCWLETVGSKNYQFYAILRDEKKCNKFPQPHIKRAASSSIEACAYVWSCAEASDDDATHQLLWFSCPKTNDMLTSMWKLLHSINWCPNASFAASVPLLPSVVPTLYTARTHDYKSIYKWDVDEWLGVEIACRCTIYSCYLLMRFIRNQ